MEIQNTWEGGAAGLGRGVSQPLNSGGRMVRGKDSVTWHSPGLSWVSCVASAWRKTRYIR